jgi:hypothetical protein
MCTRTSESCHGASAEAPDLARGDVRIELSLTNRYDPKLTALLTQIQSHHAGQGPVEIVVDEVPRSLADLESVAAAQEGWSTGSIEGHYSFGTGTVTTSTPEGPRPGFRMLSSCADVSGGTLDGGREVRVSNHSAPGCTTYSSCTTGFPMRFAATYGIVTAGHCIQHYPANSSGFVLNHTDRDTDLHEIWQPTQIYASANAYWHWGPFDPRGTYYAHDVGYLRRLNSSTSYPGRIWKYSTGEWRNIVSYAGDPAPEGSTVCVSASAASENGAGEYCGAVIAADVNYAGEVAEPTNFTEIHFPDPDGQFPIFHGPGDGSSGGPAYFAGIVYGIYSSADYCTELENFWCTPGRFEQVESAWWAMRSVSSDVHFICYPSQLCGLTP